LPVILMSYRIPLAVLVYLSGIIVPLFMVRRHVISASSEARKRFALLVAFLGAISAILVGVVANFAIPDWVALTYPWAALLFLCFVKLPATKYVPAAGLVVLGWALLMRRHHFYDPLYSGVVAGSFLAVLAILLMHRKRNKSL